MKKLINGVIYTYKKRNVGMGNLILDLNKEMVRKADWSDFDETGNVVISQRPAPVNGVQEIVSKLITKYHVHVISINEFSVITSKAEMLVGISLDYDCNLFESKKLDNLVFYGRFRIK